jgi:uncharacterized oxidoreductase
MAVTMQAVPATELKDFVASVFSAAGSAAQESADIALHLVEANLTGHDSHGVIRVPRYLEAVASGAVIPNRHIEIAVDAGGLLVVDGGFGFGQVIGREAMALLAARARRHGMATIGVRNSGHLGRIGAWAEQLVESGLVSIHFVNTSGRGILVAPFGATDRRLSANPIAAGAPGPDGPVILDIATSATAEGKIQVARNKGVKLPKGLLLDGAGQPTNDPQKFYASPPGAILPIGGHKGSGLSIFCEILAGSLTGGASSHPKNPTAARMVNNMLSIAFAPEALGQAAAFGADVTRLVGWVQTARPAQPGQRPLLPGEPERRMRAERISTGIPLDATTCAQLAEAADKLGVSAPEALTPATPKRSPRRRRKS